MSPIYVRPAREQHEHDRLIRFLQRQLQAKHKKKLEISINPGDEQTTAVKVGGTTLFPDLVLAEGKALAGIIEIETGESVNNLEAMHQWVPFSKTKIPFHLYVPVPGYDTAKRLMQAYQARVTEIWTYRPANDGFDLVRMHTDPSAVSAGKSVKAVLVSVAPKPVLPPPPPEPPPAPPRPAGEVKAGAKGAVKGIAAAKAAAVVPARPAAQAKPVAADKSVVPAKPAAAPKPPVKPAKAAAKPAAKPAPKKAAPKAKPAKPAKAAKAKPSKAAKPAKLAKNAKPAAGKNGKNKGSAGKKGR